MSGLECPTPTRWTLGHNRRCALLVALEHCRKRDEHRTTTFDRRGSKAMPCSESKTMTALYPLPTRSLRSLLEEGGLAPTFS
jgi:hypothetical protein